MSKILLLFLIFLPLTVIAGVSGDIALTTNYLSEGSSSSEDKPALQGNITLDIPKDFYINFWGSNVNFPAPDGDKAHKELEAMLGNHRQVTPKFSYDAFIGRYAYPGATSADYTEAQLTLTYLYYSLIADYSYDIFGYENTPGGYLEGDVNYPLFNWHAIKFYANARLGHYQLDPTAGETHNYYYVGFDAFYKSVDLLVQYSDTFSDPQLRGAEYHDHLLATLTYHFK
ncbi:MAG: hypothetical protein CMF49_06075 [Legionellales bacterium]|nr:hypothetical protein [Legionellales bacterium]